MAKQTLIIETAKSLSLRGGMIVIEDRTTETETLRSLEDVRMIIVDHHSVSLTVPLINRLSDNNVCVVFCDETHMPVTMTMDLESHSMQSKRFQHQLSASLPTNKRLWKQIVEAKIRNQSRLLQKRGVEDRVLARYYTNVKSNDSTNREGAAAKVYWKKLVSKDFVRDRYGMAPNSLLNYGYALMRAAMARCLMNAGLLPTVGIFHKSCYNAFPLADDMMEPYRPFVDRKVMELYESGVTDVGRETKRTLLEMFYSDISMSDVLLSASTLSDTYEPFL
ncbi:MAG: type II CRISPR-associated endonuclease Cas1 [Paludibacteraceae bacterium]|nr:type II CRISPR-associated endonuclease Cas1 [Paludibacteraceae bacterium]